MKTIKTAETPDYYDGILTFGAQEPFEGHCADPPQVAASFITVLT